MPAELLDDDLFDDQLPDRVQHHSSIHFTPVDVARFAARLLDWRAGTRILDVGAGIGKFCLVAAREAPTATFVGVELRAHLVEIAQQLADKYARANVRFVHGDALDLDWLGFDAFYFYNPFAEQRHRSIFVMDRTITLAPENFDHYVREVRMRLARAAIGTRVVTYHGLGGDLPRGFDRVSSFAIAGGTLDLWIKSAKPTRLRT
jgi:SAM-dependent methyltransferase